MSRYQRREKAINENEMYDKLLKDRGVKRIEQHRTPDLLPAEDEALSLIETQAHFWSMGDSYWKLSTLYYGDPVHWWVIASFNKRPTEAHNMIGDRLDIPVNLAEALQVVG